MISKKKKCSRTERVNIWLCCVCVCVRACVRVFSEAGTRTELSSSGDVLLHLFIYFCFLEREGVTKRRWERRPVKEQMGKKKQGLESMWAAWEILTHRVRETRYNYPARVCVCVCVWTHVTKQDNTLRSKNAVSTEQEMEAEGERG